MRQRADLFPSLNKKLSLGIKSGVRGRRGLPDVVKSEGKEINDMSASVPPDLQRAIDARLATGKYATPDDVLRDAIRALDHEDEEVAAIQEAIDDWQQGDEGLPLNEAFEEIRQSIRRGTSP